MQIQSTKRNLPAMATILSQSSINPAIYFAVGFLRYHNLPRAAAFRRVAVKVRAFSNQSVAADAEKLANKPPICTADELHYVSVGDWKLALWRYNPSPQAPARNHPLLLLSGVGTNAIGYDLAPESSFARHMCGQGFETWILEVRGAGLSIRGSDAKDVEKSARVISDDMEAALEIGSNGPASTEDSSPPVQSTSHNSDKSLATKEVAQISTAWDESKVVTELTDTFMGLSEKVSGFLSEKQSNIMSAKLFDSVSNTVEDSFIFEKFNELKENFLSLMETRQKNSGVAAQIRELSQKLVDIIEERQRSVSPPLFDMQERFVATLDDFQKQLDLIIKYDWDLDHYLEEDIPAVVEYIRTQSKPKDGRLLAIGHSMGGIMLYAMLSRFSSEGKDPGFAAIVTLGSSLDYTTSKSTLKLLLPLADPAQALNVPVVPLGALLTASYPLTSRPPYVLAWVKDLISAEDMMHPELLKKLVLNNFCNISAKLILQLATAFRDGGLRDRSGTFFYKDHLHDIAVPVLAVAGDQDTICPPEAVQETAKLIPEHLATYRVFGEPNGPHYAHYDLVGARLAAEQVYPCIIEFLSRHDSAQ